MHRTLIPKYACFHHIFQCSSLFRNWLNSMEKLLKKNSHELKVHNAALGRRGIGD